MHPFIHTLVPSLLPQQCLLCHDSCLPGDTFGLCRGCLKELPWNNSACQRCALPLPPGQNQQLCGQCQQSPPPFHAAHAAWRYAAPMDFLVQQIKFHDNLACARTLGELLAHSLQAQAIPKPGVIIPVPLHSKRQRQRGFNQALEIARPVSKRLNIPIDSRSCRRIKATEPQSDLSLTQRYGNLKAAFSVTNKLKTSHVAIIDDVMTSTQTASALANELLKQGVEHVTVWCCARTTHQAG